MTKTDNEILKECMKNYSKEVAINQAISLTRQECEKDFGKEAVSYYKGRKVTDADTLLLRTAENNFKAGKQAERKRILEIHQRLSDEYGSWSQYNKKFKSEVSGEPDKEKK